MSLSHSSSIDIHAKELLTNCGGSLFNPHLLQGPENALKLVLMSGLKPDAPEHQ